MTGAVFDANVIVAGAGWQGEPNVCLVAMARRRVKVFTSAWILEEARRNVGRLQSERIIRRDPWPMLTWFASQAVIVVPAPTGKPRSRDPKDDPVLGTALAARVKFLLTFDKDLLDLERPFGIEILRPGDFLTRLQRPV